jgi:hypothetical protein
VQAALKINALFPIGVVLALLMAWAFANTRWGLVVRMVGDSADAAKALGTSVNGVRIAATTAGGFIAGLGGASLSLYYPGSWNEGLSSGQGLIAVALVIFARWSPVRCLGAALLFGGAGALGPALQSVGVSGYYHLFNAVPYVLTLAILVWTCSPTAQPEGCTDGTGSVAMSGRSGPFPRARSRSGWPEQVAARRGRRPGAAAAAGGRDPGAAEGAGRAHLLDGGQGAAQPGHDGPGGVPRVRAARPVDEHRAGADGRWTAPRWRRSRPPASSTGSGAASRSWSSTRTATRTTPG